MVLDLPLNKPKQEAFAQARASGAPRTAAAKAAGYVGKNTGKRLDGDAAVRERIGVILAKRAGGGSRDVAGLIDRLVALAETAAMGGEAKAWDVARACLGDAARLKGSLPADIAPAPAPGTRELTIEEWRARHDPAARELSAS